MLHPYMANMMPFFNPLIASNMNMMINQPMAPKIQTVNPMFMSHAHFNMMINPSSAYMNSTMMISQPMTNIMPASDMMKISDMRLITNQPMTNTPSSINTIITPNSNMIINQRGGVKACPEEFPE